MFRKLVGSLKVKDLYHKNYAQVHVDDSIKTVVQCFKNDPELNIVLVFSKSRLVGVIHKIDLFKLVIKNTIQAL